MKRFAIYPHPENDPTGFAQIFREELCRDEYEETFDFTEADVIYAFEHPRLFSRSLKSLKKSRGLKILLRFEPIAVNPILYRRETLQIYDKVLSVGGTKHIGISDQPIHWPYFSHPNPAKPELRNILDPKSLPEFSNEAVDKRAINISMIVSNKVAWSHNSNYDLRRKIVLKSSDLGLNCFGMGWKASRWSRFLINLRLYTFFMSQGIFCNPSHITENLYFSKRDNISSVVNKFDILRDSKFHLVIENSSTYISEKLLDALVAGAVPIYVGPELGPYGLPAECVITPKSDLKGVIDAVLNLNDYELEVIRQRISTFLTLEDGLRPWEPSKVAKSIIALCR